MTAADAQRPGGSLILIATPIGNLGDLSPRAAEALRSADLVCCEDTRRTSKLYSHLGVARPPMTVVNEHTEYHQVERIVSEIASGRRIALVSDAGHPAISDPGEILVAAVVAAGLPVSVVPGPSAAISAVAISGLPTARFTMEGFLPRSGTARREHLADLAGERRTMVFYEAPHRLARTLADLAVTFGPERRLALVRELTKLHEQTWRGTLGEAVAHSAAVEPRGEYVVVVEGAPKAPAPEMTIGEALEQHRAAGLDRKQAVAEVTAQFAVPKKQVYAAALELDWPAPA